MADPNRYKDEINRALQELMQKQQGAATPPTDPRAGMSYIEPLAQVLNNPRANYRNPNDPAAALLNQLLGTTDYEAGTQKNKAHPLGLGLKLSQPSSKYASDIPGSKFEYNNPERLHTWPYNDLQGMTPNLMPPRQSEDFISQLLQMKPNPRKTVDE